MLLDLQHLHPDGPGHGGLHPATDSDLVGGEGKGEQQHSRSLVELSEEIGEGSQTALFLVDGTGPSASLSRLQRDLAGLGIEADDLHLE